MTELNFVQKFIWISERIILLIIAVATIYASGIEIVRMINEQMVNLSDLFLLFIYAEVLGMVATFYANNRIPVTLPLIIAMTALTRMIILQSKDLNAINIIYEATGILILSIAAYIMTLKDKISLKKLLLREKIEDADS
ncbi:MAG: phosphate-starvation-inducible E-like protein [SAR86 cluster bacterium]|jgi:protein PsiE|uniref:Protein PsiE n=1 Tax=SAR86 cluster bacterium TaxID=2030880 RepID=A0A520N0Y2_9GAMM|nr:MAG: phosphate-starvation-inducible E-like protein [Gammaproteobacteria bacterium TMED225]RZO27119.1 MAG: phosphate-starvation-inducible E-like protein [SAR86 cluster bacterium]|tara:strand:- start:5484 stop:5900 length:417 start_codon:yes stop_codon:yes gene_type:complete